MEFNVNDLLTKDKKTIEQGGHVQNKGGRPKVEKVKNKRVTAYFTDEDFALLKQKANGLSLAAFISSLVLEHIKNKD
ncbi:MAG: hypothetical protein PHE73_08440 [Sulfurovaceae bacterium]|nr:hypothetical protein [Sulfurovaceae bacterium]